MALNSTAITPTSQRCHGVLIVKSVIVPTPVHISPPATDRGAGAVIASVEISPAPENSRTSLGEPTAVLRLGRRFGAGPYTAARTVALGARASQGSIRGMSLAPSHQRASRAG